MYNLDYDIKEVLSNYELLKYNSNSKKFSGEIEVIKGGLFIDIFSIEIIIPNCFPRCFPKVIEIGNKIPRKVARHVIPKTNHLCLAVEIEEFLLCQGGITMKWFIDKVLVPRLCEEYRVINGEKYQKEYSHDFGGTWEYLMKVLNVNEPEIVMKFIKALADKKRPTGNSLCLCESNKPFRLCHKSNISTLQHLGINRLKSLYKSLIEKPYKGINL